jgi:hypothetical protein
LFTHNTKSLLALFLVAGIVGAISWHLLAVVAIQHPTAQNFSSQANWGYDFGVYYLAAKTLVSGGDIHHIPYHAFSWLAKGWYPTYLYPPPSIYLFVPFTIFTFDQARIAVAGVYVAALLLTIFFTTKILRGYGVSLSRLALLLMGASVFLFEPIALTFAALNVNALILFLITLFYYLLFTKKRPGISGVVLGIATLTKVIPVILILLDPLHKLSKKLAISTIATLAVASILALWLQGISAWRSFLEAFLNFESVFPSKAAILAPAVSDANVSITTTIVKIVTVLNLNVSTALLILDLAKAVFILGTFLYLFKISKIKITDTKEWEILSFTLLLLSILAVANVVEPYYASLLILSFILVIFVVPLTRSEKVILWGSLALFAARIEILSLFWRIGGAVKIDAYIVEPPTVAYILLIALLFYMIKQRTKHGYWSAPA